MMDRAEYDVFISYSRKDNAGGWVSGLRGAIYDDFREFSAEPFRIFFDTSEIHSREDWQLRLRQGLVTSRVLLVCLSPNYLRSPYCRWEWEEFARVQARRLGGGDPVTGVYFVELGGQQYDEVIEAWRHEVERVQVETLQPWFPSGVDALQQAEVRERITALGAGVHEQLRQTQLAKAAPGNLRRHNPLFVGRVEEMRNLRHALTASSVGVVTAVHGIGGVGKTELAVTYAHAYAHTYQGGTWQVDADGQTDMLEAISTLALSPELGIDVTDEQLKDRNWLGRRVLARLRELTETATDRARTEDPGAGAAGCLLLLDNVSEPAMLAETQLAVLPDQSWFHLIVTTRMGLDDIGAVGTRSSVAMIEVGRLADDDALALIREHQPARDTARLHPDFRNAVEEEAAEKIVDQLDGYTLAVEQAAVYLGTTGTEPTQLLELLRAHGAALLDQFGSAPQGAQAIRHKEKLAAVIVDQTLQRLPRRAQDALAMAALLPPDTIPWQWLQQLTEEADGERSTGMPRLPGLSGGDDWSATRRMLEGRRLLTSADDARFARMHRVLGPHLRTKLVNPDTEERLDALLKRISEELRETTDPDTALLTVTSNTVTGQLTDNADRLPNPDLAAAGLWLIHQVQSRLDLATTHTLATATLKAYQRLSKSDEHNIDWQRDLAISLRLVGDVLDSRGDSDGALTHQNQTLQMFERLAEADPDNAQWQSDLADSLDRVGGLLHWRGDLERSLEKHTRALRIRERLSEANPDNTDWRRALAISHNHVGTAEVVRGDWESGLDWFTRALDIAERLADADPQNAQWQSDLASCLTRVGASLGAGRLDLAGRLDCWTRALQIVERLSDADPGNIQMQSDLADSLESVGGALGDDDGDEALSQYIRALHIRERLAEADPDNTQRQHDLASSLESVGGALSDGDGDEAARQHTRALHIRERLAEADPRNTRWQFSLSSSHEKVAGVLAARGDTDGALDHYTKALRAREKLAETDPDNPDWQHQIAFSHYDIASLLEETGDPSAADHWAKAHQILAAWDATGNLPASLRNFFANVESKLTPG
jgi:tetratricopeptide (TPR) repeat protein